MSSQSSAGVTGYAYPPIRDSGDWTRQIKEQRLYESYNAPGGDNNTDMSPPWLKFGNDIKLSYNFGRLALGLAQGNAFTDSIPPPPPPPTPLERMRTIFASTGLSDSEITTMYSYLGPTNAVVFGSAPLYAFKGVDTLNGVPVGDIDIFCDSNGIAYDQITQILIGSGFSLVNINHCIESGGPQPSTIPGKDWNIVSMSTYTTGDTNPIVFEPSIYDNSERCTDIYSHATNFGANTRFDYLSALQYQKNGGTIVQILKGRSFHDLPSGTDLVSLMAEDGDFTVAAGTFDGSAIHMPYPDDVLTMKTTYREVIYVNPGTSWALYRLQKFIARGFFIYFANQTQIDNWNSLINWHNLALHTSDYWYTSVQDGPAREALALTGYCPFPLRV